MCKFVLCFLCHWYLSNIICLFCLARFSHMSSVSIFGVVKGEIWARTTCRLNSRFSKTIKVRQFPTWSQKMTGRTPEVHSNKRFTCFKILHLTFDIWHSIFIIQDSTLVISIKLILFQRLRVTLVTSIVSLDWVKISTTLQKLGRCASRRVRSVLKSLGWVSFGSKK